jgi:hypothetical protein
MINSIRKWLSNFKFLAVLWISMSYSLAYAVPDFSVPLKMCEGQEVVFINISTVNINDLDSFRWGYEDANVEFSATNTATWTITGSNQIVSVILTQYLANGDSLKKSKSIEISKAPVVSFQYSETCLGNSTSFINKSPFTELEFSWNFGDGTYDTNYFANHTYAIAGEYNVSLSTNYPNGCSNEYIGQAIVNDLPNSEFDVKCEGDEVYFTASQGNDVYSWRTERAGKSKDQNPIFSKDDVHGTWVCLATRDGLCWSESCQDVSCQFIDINKTILLNAVSIYPNPSNGSFRIDVPNRMAIDFSIDVIDILGASVSFEMVQNSNSEIYIRLPSVTAGLYYLRITSEDFSVSRQLQVLR